MNGQVGRELSTEVFWDEPRSQTPLSVKRATPDVRKAGRTAGGHFFPLEARATLNTQFALYLEDEAPVGAGPTSSGCNDPRAIRHLARRTSPERSTTPAGKNPLCGKGSVGRGLA